ncbi:hypothetical protein HPB47_005657 [Ixodes persulcatus]|uniref:Uncharacterized protein n=1 Tax=Ixodes persulcatus TaxID=34615 RepID=A0AC60PCC1_IXOPE|nr:hypothetical protein HPB47_005657 [Ixodes persulcatus]
MNWTVGGVPSTSRKRAGEVSSTSHDEDQAKVKKTFQQSWLEDPLFKGWLAPVKVTRLLECWDVLKVFFQDAAKTDKLKTTDFILCELNNEFTKAYLFLPERLAHLWNLVFLLHRRLQRWVPLWSRILQLQQLFPLLDLVHPWIQARQQTLATLMSPGLLLLPLALVHPWTQGSLQTLAALPCPGPLLSLAPLRGLLENFQFLPWLGSRQGHETTSTRP